MRAFTTDYAKQEFWKETDIPVKKMEDCMHVVNIYPELKGQIIQGFGGAFTEATTYNYSLLGEENRKQVMEGYFGEDGLRYNMARTHIHSCDFSLGNYTYLKDGDDPDSFSIEHDRDNMIPIIKEAMTSSATSFNFWRPHGHHRHL